MMDGSGGMVANIHQEHISSAVTAISWIEMGDIIPTAWTADSWHELFIVMAGP